MWRKTEQARSLEPAFPGNRGLIRSLIGIGLLLAATVTAYRTVPPLGVTASPTEFSAYRARAILEDLGDASVPHPIGSPANAEVRDAIVRRLTALGYAVELESGFVCSGAGACGSPVNVVATQRARADEDGAVLLAAHYDSVAAGPGASDDGAGVASVLEIARALRASPPTRHPIVLLIDEGEE